MRLLKSENKPIKKGMDYSLEQEKFDGPQSVSVPIYALGFRQY